MCACAVVVVVGVRVRGVRGGEGGVGVQYGGKISIKNRWHEAAPAAECRCSLRLPLPPIPSLGTDDLIMDGLAHAYTSHPSADTGCAVRTTGGEIVWKEKQQN